MYICTCTNLYVFVIMYIHTCTVLIKNKVSILVVYFTVLSTTSTKLLRKCMYVALMLQPYFYHTSNPTYGILEVVVNKKSKGKEICS